ncbi:MAG TPA: 16S rRNA (cytosine(967)-C(5))-methyltransferase RsmB [bacterium]|nr:16S rRNA (cytosine(967)-C(5))-methyltransferase RsmB [bacterium]
MGPRRDSVSPSRWYAADALLKIEKGAKIADVFKGLRALKPEDQSLGRELIYGCTRQKKLLDYHLASFCAKPYQKLPVEIHIALRLGLYQMLFLDRIPAHAAVNESVGLVKKTPFGELAGLVNALLRTAEKKKAQLEVKGKDEFETLAIRHSHPDWMVRRWGERLSLEKLEELLRADNQPHPVYLKMDPARSARILESLANQSFKVEPLPWPPHTARILDKGVGLFETDSFNQGDWIVQDWVPQAMLEMVPVKPGQKLWDVCAAPGGKSIGLGWLVGNQGQVLASDAAPERLKKLEENLKRIQMTQVRVVESRIEKLPPSQKFDLVWVDAPCSGTGVLSRRADLRWKLQSREIIAQAERQLGLLKEAQGHVYANGYLVYSTCSLEPEENDGVVEAFLLSHPEYEVYFPPLPVDRPEIEKVGRGLMFWPRADHDGGYLAVLKKKMI